LQQDEEEEGGVTGLLRSSPVGILYLKKKKEEI